MLYRRDRAHKDGLALSPQDARERLAQILDEIHQTYFTQAQTHLRENTVTDIASAEDFRSFFTPKNKEKPEIHGGFVRGKWCEDEEASAALLSELKVTIRCLPAEQSREPGTCIITGKPATAEAIFAKAY